MSLQKMSLSNSDAYDFRRKMIAHLESNELLHYWVNEVPMNVIITKMHHYLSSMYLRKNFYSEYYTLMCVWCNAASHFQETLGDINVKFTSFISHFLDLPLECFKFSLFNDDIGDKFVMLLLFTIYDFIVIDI